MTEETPIVPGTLPDVEPVEIPKADEPIEVVAEAVPAPSLEEVTRATGMPKAEVESVMNIAQESGQPMELPKTQANSTVGKEYVQNGIKYRRVQDERGNVSDVPIQG